MVVFRNSASNRAVGLKGFSKIIASGTVLDGGKSVLLLNYSPDHVQFRLAREAE